ncbi:hypothetical protein HY629_00695, partial [Candidatus Uhrbacteria bacterium]|nr:hypothetical protein [Candidatus Uhrbacteria bacterium]
SWGSNGPRSLAYDSFNHVIFLAATGTNQFGKYDPASDTFTDLSSRITSWSDTVLYLIYDSFNHLLFFTSSSVDTLGKYDPATDAFTDLSSKIDWTSSVLGYLAYDSFNHLIFFGSASAANRFGKYDPASDIFTDLSPKITWAPAAVRYLAFDSFNHTIFFGSSGTNQFGKYDPASDAFTDLSGKISSYGSIPQYLTYDSFNYLVFFGSTGGTNKLGKFSPSLSKHTDNLLFFDESDYSAVGTSPDNIFSSVTSYPHASVGTQSITSYPSFLFKQKADHTGDRITISWTGQTTTTVQPVYLQVYDHNVTEGVATSTTAWKTIAFRSATFINTNFTLSGTLTENFPVPNAGTTTRYFTKHQNGVDPLASTTITLRVYQEHQTIGNEIPGPITLRTDSLSVSQRTLAGENPKLTQTAILWENDDGTTPDTNTVTTGPSTSPSSILLGVRRGERLNLRFQVANTGTIAMANKILKLQYHATSVPALTLDCTTANPTSSSTWFDVGEGGPSNFPNVPTSVSPTSVNYSLANSGDLADSVSQNKLPAPKQSDGVTPASFQNGYFNDNSPRTATGVTVNSNSYSEHVFPVHFGDSMAAASFCFRLVSETDQGAIPGDMNPYFGQLDAYQVYAKAQVRSVSENTQRYSKGVQATNKDGEFVNLTSKISSYGVIQYLAYDSFNHLIFFGSSGTNRLGKYNPATDTFTNLSTKITWNPSVIVAFLSYDSFNHFVF